VEGTYIAVATADNSVAEDNPSEGNGLFTKHLLAALTTPGMDLKQAFERTKEAVYAASDHHQRPYTYDGVVGQYYFNSPVTIVNNPPPSPDLSAQQELAFWNGVDKTDAQSLELYLQAFRMAVSRGWRGGVWRSCAGRLWLNPRCVWPRR